MEKKLVSVIIPVYKVEKYLKKCVDSVIGQTYQNLEIILVDDGSPDRCGEICDEYQRIDSRIRVIHKENGGLSDARNAGIDAAHGDYLMFVDSDDYIAAAMVEKLLTALETEQAGMSLCNFLYVAEDGAPMEECNQGMPVKTEVLSGVEAIHRLSLERGECYTIACCKLYQAALFREIRFPRGKRNEDEFVSHILFHKCDRVACLGEALYYYVQRADSIMGQRRASRSISDLDVVEAFMDRALYLAPLGLYHDAAWSYLTAAMLLSEFVTQYRPKSDEERARMNELLALVLKNHHFSKYCSLNGKVHIMLIRISPTVHQFFYRNICKVIYGHDPIEQKPDAV